MPAAIGAACPPLEMIVRRENHVAEIIQVVGGFQGNHSFRLREESLGVVPFKRKPGDGLKTGAAKTAGFDAIRGEPVQDVIWHDDLMAPARPLIEMTFGHAALVVSPAPGALLITPQIRAWRYCRRRFVVSSVRFHERGFVQA
jgi:hypothetical protein